MGRPGSRFSGSSDYRSEHTRLGPGDYRHPTRAPDIAASTRTTASLVAGSSLGSTIDASGDADWIRVSLVAGRRYTFDLAGRDSSAGTLVDPMILGLYSSTGRVISGTRDDDSGPGYESQLNYTATQTGTYYLSAGSYGTGKGTYRLSLTDRSSDTVAPTLVSQTPLTQATEVSRSADIVLQFTETVRAGSGVVTLSSASQTLQIQISDTSQVSFSGSTLTINPSSDLAANTQYTVSLGAGTVLDAAGNAFSSTGTVAQFTTEAEQVIVPGTPKAWTIMVYMAADNNLESFAVLDLNEMEAALGSSDIQSVVMMDRSPGYDYSAGNWTDTRMGAVTRDGSSTALASLGSGTSIGEVNTGDPDTLTDFINWTVAHHPADNYALVIWDHGGGLSGAAWDDTNGGDNLTLKEIASALTSANLDNLDILAFDACLMGMVEVATEFEGLADYLVASEELVPGDGFAYDDLLNAVNAFDEASALDVVNAMLTTYAAEYAGQRDITMSAVDLTQVDALNAALNQFTNVVIGQLGTRSTLTAVRTAARDSVDFPSDASYDYVDLRDFMSRLTGNSVPASVRTAAAGVITALDAAVLDEVGTVSRAGGLSIYLPFGSDWVDPGYNASQYAFAAAVPRWDDFLAII